MVKYKNYETESPKEALKYKNKGLSMYQVRELLEAEKHDIDTSDFSDKKFNHRQMRELWRGRLLGVDISGYLKSHIPFTEMRERKLESLGKIDVDKFLLNENFDEKDFSSQMKEEIKIALEYNIDIKDLLDKGFSAGQMKQIISGKLSCIDTSIYENANICEDKMRELRGAILQDIYVVDLANEDYSADQVREIWYLRAERIDSSVIEDKNMDPLSMKNIREYLEEQNENSKSASYDKEDLKIKIDLEKSEQDFSFEEDINNKVIVSYFVKDKNIDKNAVAMLINEKMLYQDIDKNCVFVSGSQDEKIKHAYKIEKGDLKRLNKEEEPVFIGREESKGKELVITDSIIDAIKMISLEKNDSKSFSNNKDYLILEKEDVVKLDNYIKNKEYENISVSMLDNKKAENIYSTLKEKYKDIAIKKENVYDKYAESKKSNLDKEEEKYAAPKDISSSIKSEDMDFEL